MKLGFIVYDGVTLLDFAGMFDPLTRLKTMGFLPDLSYSICAPSGCAAPGWIQTCEGLRIKTDSMGESLESFDYILIPGGMSITSFINNTSFINWTKSASSTAIFAAVCGGALLLGISGLLAGKNATTHPALMDFLSRFTDKCKTERIVHDGNIITAGGVASSIDLGLYVCEQIAGTNIRQKIQQQMDYPHYPPAR